MIPEGFYPPIVINITVYILAPCFVIFLSIFAAAFIAISLKLDWNLGDGETLKKITLITAFTEFGFICLLVITIVDINFGKETLTTFFIVQAFYQSSTIFLGFTISFAFKASSMKSGSSDSKSNELSPRTHEKQKSFRDIEMDPRQEEMSLQLEKI